MISEGKAILDIKGQSHITRKMPVFYNPLMELNRTVSILLLNAIEDSDIQMAFPLAGSGVRGIRFSKELQKDKIRTLCFNDINPVAVRAIKRNIRINNVKKASVSHMDANLFLLNSKGFDYIDIDPFGSPNDFLDAAVKRLSREGILAVTATDTSALCGTHPKACLRKYWSVPARNDMMHEIGLRILIRKCQLIGAQYDKALIPIYSYAKEHYMRAFFRCSKGKARVDEILLQHGMIGNAGPLWVGNLWEKELAEKIAMDAPKEHEKFLEMIAAEAKVESVGFYHLPSLAGKLAHLPRQELIVREIEKKGYTAVQTHFSPNSIRSNIPKQDLNTLIQALAGKL